MDHGASPGASQLASTDGGIASLPLSPPDVRLSVVKNKEHAHGRQIQASRYRRSCLRSPVHRPCVWRIWLRGGFRALRPGRPPLPWLGQRSSGGRRSVQHAEVTVKAWPRTFTQAARPVLWCNTEVHLAWTLTWAEPVARGSVGGSGGMGIVRRSAS